MWVAPTGTHLVPSEICFVAFLDYFLFCCSATFLVRCAIVFVLCAIVFVRCAIVFVRCAIVLEPLHISKELLCVLCGHFLWELITAWFVWMLSLFISCVGNVYSVYWVHYMCSLHFVHFVHFVLSMNCNWLGMICVALLGWVKFSKSWCLVGLWWCTC